MPRHCYVLKLNDPKLAFKELYVCGDLRPHKCQVCHTGLGRYRCDYPVAPGKTCDRYLCEQCRQAQGLGIDYCPKHAAVKSA